jgi:predicted GH43/DUF377 family glycosyl hydrolase
MNGTIPGTKSVFPELFHRHDRNPILTVRQWPYPANSVFNASAATVDGETVLLVRVKDRCGMSHLTVASSKDGYSDWIIDPTPTLSP